MFYLGNCCSQLISYKSTSQVVLYTTTGFYDMELPINSQCSKCKASYIFDGKEYGIINYRNKHLFALELLLELLYLKSYDGTPTFTYWISKIKLFAYSGNKAKSLKAMAGKINSILTSFLKLIEYPDSFMNCCKDPDIVCVDGIVLSADHMKVKHQQLDIPWRAGALPASQRFSTRKERQVWYLSEQHRNLIRAYVRSGITSQELQILIEIEPEPKVVTNFIISCSTTAESPTGELYYRSPATLRTFFECLYKQIAPTAAIMPSFIWSTIQAVLDDSRIDAEQMKIVNGIAPVTGALLTFIFSQGLLQAGLPLIQHLLLKSKGCYSSETQKERPFVRVDAEYTDPRKEVMETGVFFPGRPIVGKVFDLKVPRDNEAGCNKEYYPGTLLFWCGIHRECLGFYVLSSHESLTQVHHIFASRFPVLPKLIIYDNGCNFHDFVLNRDPLLYLNTMVVSDGFHWKNHTNCGVIYNSNAYEGLKGFNSVLHEQMNVVLDKLKPTSIHMRFDSFVELLIYTLAHLNHRSQTNF